jgi:hypothetical protein
MDSLLIIIRASKKSRIFEELLLTEERGCGGKRQVSHTVSGFVGWIE